MHSYLRYLALSDLTSATSSTASPAKCFCHRLSQGSNWSHSIRSQSKLLNYNKRVIVMCAYEHNLRVISHELAMLNVKSKRYQCSSKASQLAGPPNRNGIGISPRRKNREKGGNQSDSAIDSNVHANAFRKCQTHIKSRVDSL